MQANLLEQLRIAIRDVPDFPQKGILFKDITPILADPHLMKLAIDGMVEPFAGLKIDKVVGIDARGFIFGSMIAQRLNAGFVPVRKRVSCPGKQSAWITAWSMGPIGSRCTWTPSNLGKGFCWLMICSPQEGQRRQPCT